MRCSILSVILILFGFFGALIYSGFVNITSGNIPFQPSAPLQSTPIPLGVSQSNPLESIVISFLGLVEACIWPIVVLILLTIFYRPLSQFVGDIGKRATKISAFQFSVELPTIKGPAKLEVDTGGTRLTPTNVNSSYIPQLIDAVTKREPSQYMVVDLRRGEGGWLTSRLFLFTAILQREFGLKCVVFVYTRTDTLKVFAGLATPEDVLQGLARSSFWLEDAYIHSITEIINTQNTNDPNKPLNLKDFVRFSYLPEINFGSELATQITMRYLSNSMIQVNSESLVPAHKKNEWEPLKKDGNIYAWEHAAWLAIDNLETILGKGVVNEQAYVRSSQLMSVTERNQAIMLCQGPFVALVDEDKVFTKLIDRDKLVENSIQKSLES